MNTDRSYIDSKLSERPDYSIAGELVPGIQSAYFSEKLSKETIREFSKIPESLGKVRRHPGRGAGRKTRNTYTLDRVVKKTTS